MTITSLDALHDWLKEHHYFQEQYCFRLHPPPESPMIVAGTGAPVIELDLGYKTGGFDAGDLKVISSFRLRASGDASYIDVADHGDAFADEPRLSADIYMDEGVEAFERDGYLALSLRLWDVVTFRFKQLHIEPRPDRTEVVPAKVAGTSFTATVSAGDLPTPQEWIDWCKAAGHVMVWRVWGGGEWPAEHLPQESYSGFLQSPGLLESESGGVWCRVDATAAGGFQAHLDDGLARVALRFINRYRDARVKSGNCHFTASQWRRFLLDGELPTQSR